MFTIFAPMAIILALRPRGLFGRALGELLLWSMHILANFFTAVPLVFAVAVAALYLVVHSPFGYTLLGIRESEACMDCLGYMVLSAPRS